MVSPGHEGDGIFEMPVGEASNPLSPYFLAGHSDWLEVEHRHLCLSHLDGHSFLSLENPSNTNRGNALTFAEPRRGRGDRVGCRCRISVRARGRILRVCPREKAVAFVETLGRNITAVFLPPPLFDVV